MRYIQPKTGWNARNSDFKLHGLFGQPVEVKFDGPTNWKSEGVIVGGELGIEGCYYKAIVGDENVVVGCPPVCGAELPLPQPEPQPEPMAEPAVENAVELVQAELPAQVEVPAQQQSEAVFVAEVPMPSAELMPDVYEGTDTELKLLKKREE